MPLKALITGKKCWESWGAWRQPGEPRAAGDGRSTSPYIAVHSSRLPRPQALLAQWQTWKTLAGREAKSKLKWVNKLCRLPRTQTQAYCGFMQPQLNTGNTWNKDGELPTERVQLNLPSMAQRTLSVSPRSFSISITHDPFWRCI